MVSMHFGLLFSKHMNRGSNESLLPLVTATTSHRSDEVKPSSPRTDRSKGHLIIHVDQEPRPTELSKLPNWDPRDASNPKVPVRQKWWNALYIVLNTISTVAIVFLNKSIFSDPQLYRCKTSLAAWHFSATALVLFTASKPPFKAFTAVVIDIRQLLWISVLFAGFLVLGNWSLALNDVGFYQLAKIMTTPTVVLLNFVMFGYLVSKEILLAIAACCIGVAMTTSHAAIRNPLGALIAVAAFVVTAMYQIWIGKKLRDLDVSPPQLLLNQAPISVLILLAIIPLTDHLPSFHEIPTSTWHMVFWSGILASVLNLSQFLIIGSTSALSFNVVSNLKMMSIISISWFLEGKTLTPMDIVGVMLAVGGACLYSHFAMKK